MADVVLARVCRKSRHRWWRRSTDRLPRLERRLFAQNKRSIWRAAQGCPESRSAYLNVPDTLCALHPILPADRRTRQHALPTRRSARRRTRIPFLVPRASIVLKRLGISHAVNLLQLLALAVGMTRGEAERDFAAGAAVAAEQGRSRRGARARVRGGRVRGEERSRDGIVETVQAALVRPTSRAPLRRFPARLARSGRGETERGRVEGVDRCVRALLSGRGGIRAFVPNEACRAGRGSQWRGPPSRAPSKRVDEALPPPPYNPEMSRRSMRSSEPLLLLLRP